MKIKPRTHFEYNAEKKTRAALGDIIGAFRDFALSYQMARFEIRDKYARSGLGPIWNLLINLFLVSGYFAVGQYIFQIDNNVYYLCHIATGIIFWQFLVQLWGESTDAVQANYNILNNQFLTKTSLLNVVLLKQTMVLAYSIPLLIICQFALSVFSRPLTEILSLYALIPLNLLLLYFMVFPFFGIWLCLRTRYSDMVYVVTVLSQLLFFVTPVIWLVPDSDALGLKIITLGNPFHHALALLRAPFMGEIVPFENYIGALGFGLLFWLLFILVFRWAHSRLMFWI